MAVEERLRTPVRNLQQIQQTGACFALISYVAYVLESASSADEVVILSMCSNPEPLYSFWNRDAQCTIVKTHANTVELAVMDWLKMQGRMTHVTLEDCVVTASQILDVCGQLMECLPEPARRKVPQISVALPALYSAKASSARASSLPAAASDSI